MKILKFYLILLFTLLLVMSVYTYIHLKYFYYIDEHGDLGFGATYIYPCALVLLIFLILVNLNSKLFAEMSKVDYFKSLYIFYCFIFCSFPFVLMQLYIESGFQKLHTIDNVKNIGSFDDKRFIKFDNLPIDSSDLMMDIGTEKRRSKAGSSFFYITYFIAPLISDDTSKTIIVLEKDYMRLDEYEDTALMLKDMIAFENEKVNRSISEFKNSIQYLEHIHEDHNDYYLKDISIRNFNPKKLIILRTRSKMFNKRNSALFGWLVTFAIFGVVFLFYFTFLVPKRMKGFPLENLNQPIED